MFSIKMSKVIMIMVLVLLLAPLAIFPEDRKRNR